MRGLVNSLAAPVASDKELMKELAQMAARLRSLDACPDKELSQDEAEAIFSMSDEFLEAIYHVDATLHLHKLAFLVNRSPYFCCFSEKLGLDGGFKLDTNQAVPLTPAVRSVRPPAPSRRRARRAPSSSDESDVDGEVNLPAASVNRVPATPSMSAARSQRASKTAALSKMSAKPTAAAASSGESDDQSDLTSDEDSSGEDSS